MVRYVYSMQLPAALTHLSSKTKPPDPVLGIGRSPKKYTFSVSSLLSKHGRPGHFRPNPQPRSFLGTSPQQPWVVSPVGFRGRSYDHSLRRPPEVRNWGTGKPRLRTTLRIVIEFWPRHADLRFRGRSNRLSSRAIAGAARTYGVVRRPRSGPRAAFPGQEKHYCCNGSERAKPARNREGREGLPAHRQRFGVGV